MSSMHFATTHILGKKEIKDFKRVVQNFYKNVGRRHLPWRKTKIAYRIALSEIMLQQTQVDRVVPKYTAFLLQFPTVRELAEAPLGEVLRAWQGLGYNRRAKMLHHCAQVVVSVHGSRFPRTYEELVQLPGIGPYTAGAVMAFAYNKPVPIIETNIRTVFLHHFFSDKTDVSEKEILTLVEATLDLKNPREWYWALMDYGSYLKKEHGNPNSRSKVYVKQSVFQGSDRQIRGAILKCLAEKGGTRSMIHKKLSPFEDVRIDALLEKLLVERMVEKVHTYYRLPT